MARKLAYIVYPNRVMSYDTCIYQSVPGLTIGNVTYYSDTTASHQYRASSADCDLVLSDVPRNTDDLLVYAASKGLVWPYRLDLDGSVVSWCKRTLGKVDPTHGYHDGAMGYQ